MGVANRRPSSDTELTSPTEMRLLASLIRGPFLEPYQTRKHVLFHIIYFENGPLGPGKEHNYSCENEFYLHENEKSFPHQRLNT